MRQKLNLDLDVDTHEKGLGQPQFRSLEMSFSHRQIRLCQLTFLLHPVVQSLQLVQPTRDQTFQFGRSLSRQLVP